MKRVTVSVAVAMTTAMVMAAMGKKVMGLVMLTIMRMIVLVMASCTCSLWNCRQLDRVFFERKMPPQPGPLRFAGFMAGFQDSAFEALPCFLLLLGHVDLGCRV